MSGDEPKECSSAKYLNLRLKTPQKSKTYSPVDSSNGLFMSIFHWGNLKNILRKFQESHQGWKKNEEIRGLKLLIHGDVTRMMDISWI